MGLFNKLEDKIVEGAIKAETVRVSYDVLAKILTDAFIFGADDTYLEKVLKTAKGGFAVPKEMVSGNDRYVLHVGARPNGCVWLSSKPVWIYDRIENKFYQLDKDIRWKAFYNSAKNAVGEEKFNRNKRG